MFEKNWRYLSKLQKKNSFYSKIPVLFLPPFLKNSDFLSLIILVFYIELKNFKKRAWNHLYGRERGKGAAASRDVHRETVSFSSSSNSSLHLNLFRRATATHAHVYSPVSFCMMYAANGNEASRSLSFPLHLPRSFSLFLWSRREARIPVFVIFPFIFQAGRREDTLEIALATAGERREIRELNIAPRARARFYPACESPRLFLALFFCRLLASLQHRMRPLLTAFKLPGWPPWIFHDRRRRRGVPACSSPRLRCGPAIPEAANSTNDEFPNDARTANTDTSTTNVASEFYRFKWTCYCT